MRALLWRVVSADFDQQVAGVAALADEVRRRVYEHVAGQSEAVSRDAAADAAGIKRSLAAFHLDKLVAEGLLEVEYRRLTGRTGPGAGRPAKLYRRAARQFDVTLPPREYDLAGHVLAAAVQRAAGTGEDVITSLRAVAFEHGRELASDERGGSVDAAVQVLRTHGFEPRRDGDGIVLANCPFHALAQEFTQLVCGMNVELAAGSVTRWRCRVRDWMPTSDRRPADAA